MIGVNMLYHLHTAAKPSVIPGKRLPIPFEFYIDLVEALLASRFKVWSSLRVIHCIFDHIILFCIIWNQLILPNTTWYHLVSVVNQDWEDECGRTKRVQQHILLPHEIVGAFLSGGETDRMTGGNDEEARPKSS